MFLLCRTCGRAGWHCNPRRGIATTVSALAGALAGGALNYTVAQRMQPDDTEKILTSIPGISTQMVADVERQLDEQGWSALVLGPTRGVPYKIYARTLAHGHESFRGLCCCPTRSDGALCGGDRRRSRAK